MAKFNAMAAINVDRNSTRASGVYRSVARNCDQNQSAPENTSSANIETISPTTAADRTCCHR